MILHFKNYVCGLLSEFLCELEHLYLCSFPHVVSSCLKAFWGLLPPSSITHFLPLLNSVPLTSHLTRFTWVYCHALYLPRESPWTKEPGRLQSMRSQRVGHNWETKHSIAQNGVIHF